MHRTKKIIVILGCLINICGLWLVYSLQFRHDRDQTRKVAEVDASNLAIAFEENVLRSIQNIDALLVHLRDEYQRSPGNFKNSALVHQRLANSDMIIQVSVIGADGILAYNDRTVPASRLDLSDREHFKIHQDGRGDRLFISKPVLGRVSKKMSLQLSRRIYGKNGSFGGVMVLSIDPESFSGFYRTIDIGRLGTITLVGQDRVIRAYATRGTAGKSATGLTLPVDRPYFNIHSPETGVFRVPDVEDGIIRIGAYRRLQNYPLIVVVSLAEDEVYGGFRARWNFLTVMGILVSAGLLVGLWIILRLERQQQRLHARLAENEEMFRILADFTSDWEYWIDPQKRIIYTSPSCLTITGYAPEEFMQNPLVLLDIVHPEDRGHLIGHLESVHVAEGTAAPDVNELQFRIIAKNGEIRWLSHVCRPIFGRDGAYRGRRVSNRDITERRQVEEALFRNEEFLRTITDRVPGALFLLKRNTDGDLLFQWFSSRMDELIGIDAFSLMADARTMFINMHDEDVLRVKCQIEESAKSLSVLRGEWRHRHPKTDEYRWFRCDSVPRMEPDGGVVWCGYLADIQDMKVIEDQLRSALVELERLASTDPLTKLPNRRSFFRRANAEFARSQRYGRPMSVIMMDLDHFKKVNDTLGHAVGDGVLRHVAAIIQDCTRGSDIIARFGGEEFVIILPETDSGGAFVIAERLRFSVESEPLMIESGGLVNITVSLGVAILTPEKNFLVIDKLLQQADDALYQAKESGRNRVIIHN